MDLLEMAVEQHGGMRRWGEITRFRVTASFGGDIWKQHGQDGLLDEVVLTTPFLLARADFVTAELGPWREDGEVWRRLSVTYPDSVAAHSPRQTYCFDNSGLLCRTDFTIDRLLDEPLVQYAFDYCEFDGILGSPTPPRVRPDRRRQPRPERHGPRDRRARRRLQLNRIYPENGERTDVENPRPASFLV